MADEKDVVAELREAASRLDDQDACRLFRLLAGDLLDRMYAHRRDAALAEADCERVRKLAK